MIHKIQALKARKGFTLVELMVVIAIIGVLAAILIPLMNNFLQNARIQSANSTAASVRSSIIYWLTDEAVGGRQMLSDQTFAIFVNTPPINTVTDWDPAELAPGSAVFADAFNGIANNYRWREPREDRADFAEFMGGNTSPLPAGEDSALAFLAAYIQNMLPDLTNATFMISMRNNNAMSVIYYSGGEGIDLSSYMDFSDGTIVNISRGRSTDNTSPLHRQILGTALVPE